MDEAIDPVRAALYGQPQPRGIVCLLVYFEVQWMPRNEAVSDKAKVRDEAGQMGSSQLQAQKGRFPIKSPNPAISTPAQHIPHW